MGKSSANVVHLVRQRELGRTLGSFSAARGDGNRGKLDSWVEKDFLQHCHAQYADFQGAKSTIAARFSPDGATVASTQ